MLVLLPTSSNKLLVEWRSYQDFCDVCTYEVDMQNCRQRKQRLHINVLRRWVSPTADISTFADEVNSMDKDNIVPWEKAGDGDDSPVLGDSLTTYRA